MKLGPIGVWAYQLDLVPSRQSQECAAELEELGYSALWTPEAVGREAFTGSGVLLAGTSELTVATGIASIWARDAMAARAAQATLAEAYPGRFLLGLGVSHQPMVDAVRGHHYERPLAAMRRYLDAMDTALFLAAAPAVEPQRVLAALGPRMLDLAAERADGAHTYFVPPEHTAAARAALGSAPLLAVEQAVVLEADPVRAREIARGHMQMYLGLPNYARNLLRLGFEEADLVAGGSDRLVDAIVAWGSEVDLAARVSAHRDAGADHVCIQVLPAEPTSVPLDEWRRLAPVLLT